jgi:hypothetical protein
MRSLILSVILVCAACQVQIQFQINDANVASNALKEAIQEVAGVEPIVSAQTVVTDINFVPGVCQPGYYWTNISTCELCSCSNLPSTQNFIWFEPL